MIEFEQPSKPEKKKKTPRWLWGLGAFVLLGIVMELSPTVEAYVYSIARDHAYFVWIALVIFALAALTRRRVKAKRNPIESMKENTKRKSKASARWVWVACFIGVAWAGKSTGMQGFTIGICLGVLMVIRWLWERFNGGRNFFHNPDDYDWGDK